MNALHLGTFSTQIVHVQFCAHAKSPFAGPKKTYIITFQHNTQEHIVETRPFFHTLSAMRAHLAQHPSTSAWHFREVHSKKAFGVFAEPQRRVFFQYWWRYLCEIWVWIDFMRRTTKS